MITEERFLNVITYIVKVNDSKQDGNNIRMNKCTLFHVDVLVHSTNVIYV